MPIPFGKAPESEIETPIGAILSSRRVPLISRVNMYINDAPFLELEHWRANQQSRRTLGKKDRSYILRNATTNILSSPC
jgi:hypothetical protein